MVRHGWEAFENVGEITLGFDSVSLAGFEEGVDDRAFVSGTWIADEQPVFRSEFAGADTLFGQVVIDADLRMVEVDGELVPLGQGVVDSLPQGGADTDDLAGLPAVAYGSHRGWAGFAYAARPGSLPYPEARTFRSCRDGGWANR